jgi:broad specificity phosphatase PhoE
MQSEASDSATTFYFIRHGEIDANVQQKWHGSTDSLLNDTGQRQAGKMADYFESNISKISMVYTSPLSRTLKTAEALSERVNVPLEHEPDFREFSIGSLEGLPYEILAAEHRMFEHMEADHHYSVEGGESVIEVRDRFLSALTRLKDKHQGEEIAIVSHGAAVGILFAHFFQSAPYPFHEYHMVNTGISKLVWDDELPVLEIFNLSEHLQTS